VVSKLNSRLEVREFESHPMLDGNGVKTMDQFLHPILVHSIIEKKKQIFLNQFIFYHADELGPGAFEAEEDGQADRGEVRDHRQRIRRISKDLWKLPGRRISGKGFHVYVDGNIGNLALPVMPRQCQKFFHEQGPVRELTYPNLT
jgi:hypothetical protein